MENIWISRAWDLFSQGWEQEKDPYSKESSQSPNAGDRSGIGSHSKKSSSSVDLMDKKTLRSWRFFYETWERSSTLSHINPK